LDEPSESNLEKMADVIDGTLKLKVFDPQEVPSREVANCTANTGSDSISKDTTGQFYCPVVKRYAEIHDMHCYERCIHREF